MWKAKRFSSKVPLDYRQTPGARDHLLSAFQILSPIFLAITARFSLSLYETERERERRESSLDPSPLFIIHGLETVVELRKVRVAIILTGNATANRR